MSEFMAEHMSKHISEPKSGCVAHANKDVGTRSRTFPSPALRIDEVSENIPDLMLLRRKSTPFRVRPCALYPPNLSHSKRP